MKIVKVPGTSEKLLLFTGRDVLRAKTCCLRFESLADDIAISNVLLCRYTDPRSDSRPAFDQTLCFQPLHGFGDWQEAHVKPIGQFTP
jgi:hypothetical protein